MRGYGQMENVGGSAERFRPLIARSGLALHLNSEAESITRYEQLATWFASAGARVAKSSHRESSSEIYASREGQYAVAVGVDWSGVDKTRRPLAGQTRHRWLLEGGGERFCRLKQARVTVLRPLGPA
jgi:hypothetical protein